MASFEVSGKLLVKFAEQKMSEKFKKRDFVLEIKDGNYPQQIKFQLVQERCSALDSVKENDEIKVSFNLRGRPFEKNGETIYFTNLEAWKIDKAQKDSQAAPEYDDIPPPTDDFSSGDEEILPF